MMRKVPDWMDVLNLEQEKYYFSLMKNYFTNSILKEKDSYRTLLPKEVILELVNEKYNIWNDEDMVQFGHLEL